VRRRRLIAVVGLFACGRIEEESFDASDDVSIAPEGAADVRIVDVAHEEASLPPVCPHPADVSGFMPPPYVPPNPAQMKCDSIAIKGYYDNCLNWMTATLVKCAAFRMSNVACTKCLESQKTDPSWGPLVESRPNNLPLVSCNVAGCVDLKGDKNCAAAIEAFWACDDAACDMQCPADDPIYADYVKCTQEAALNGCKKYADTVTMTCANDASAAYFVCRNFADFQGCYSQYAELWCGAGG